MHDTGSKNNAVHLPILGTSTAARWYFRLSNHAGHAIAVEDRHATAASLSSTVYSRIASTATQDKGVSKIEDLPMYSAITEEDRKEVGS